MLVLVPFVRGWLVTVPASRSADPTSVFFSCLPAIAQKRERKLVSRSIRRIHAEFYEVNSVRDVRVVNNLPL